MMTDERLNAIVRHVESTHSDFGHMVMVIAHVYEMRDEIKRLRAERDAEIQILKDQIAYYEQMLRVFIGNREAEVAQRSTTCTEPDIVI